MGNVSNLLQTKKLSMHFGGVKAVDEVDISVNEGEIFGIIGPNGAGKSTFFNVLTGFYKPTSGNIYFLGNDITKRPVHEIVSLGISRTFQNIRLFDQMSVLDNMLVGMHLKIHPKFNHILLMNPNKITEESKGRKEAESVLEMFNLIDASNLVAGCLPYGKKRRLEIARAMISKPKLILLDEPSAGMNPSETVELMKLIIKIRELGPTIIVIEHNMKLIMGISDRIAVLNFGKKIAEGIPTEIKCNKQVIEAYLGREDDSNVGNL